MPIIELAHAIPPNIAKEWLSESFVRALCAQAGLNITNWKWDDGLDLTVGASKKGFLGVPFHNVKFHLQLKSTADWKVIGGKISYWLKAEKYNQLVEESVDPQHLVLYTLPPARWQWVQTQSACALMQHCAYFYSFVREKPLADESAGTTVRIPTANRLTAGELMRMYRDAAERWRNRS